MERYFTFQWGRRGVFFRWGDSFLTGGGCLMGGGASVLMGGGVTNHVNSRAVDGKIIGFMCAC